MVEVVGATVVDVVVGATVVVVGGSVVVGAAVVGATVGALLAQAEPITAATRTPADRRALRIVLGRIVSDDQIVGVSLWRPNTSARVFMISPRVA